MVSRAVTSVAGRASPLMRAVLPRFVPRAIDPAVRARTFAVSRPRRHVPGEGILIADAPGTEFFAGTQRG
ncbi:MAG: hypothetical protein CVU47_00530 [Chloroflexi bacterium HGW-Chloroflexi-9]|nr:MAG: hypothetical protein CVU47_00530 [Chloroflexi bacterium HGW-Chloroflexi-9]